MTLALVMSLVMRDVLSTVRGLCGGCPARLPAAVVDHKAGLAGRGRAKKLGERFLKGPHEALNLESLCALFENVLPGQDRFVRVDKLAWHSNPSVMLMCARNAYRPGSQLGAVFLHHDRPLDGSDFDTTPRHSATRTRCRLDANAWRV